MPLLMEETQMELPIAVLLELRARRRRASASGRLPRVRSDSLPEQTGYRDDGCDIHPHCLTCPLPRCRYEEPGGLKAMLNGIRDRHIVSLRSKGQSVEDIADQFGVSRRTIFRILTAKYKEARCA
jgi:hypothetical protein